MRASSLVGRVREIALIDGLLTEAAAGRGSVVVVRGEPGVGKSRFLSEAVQRAGATGAATLSGRAVEGGGGFRAIADALLNRQRTDGLPPASAVEPFAAALSRLVPGWSTRAEEPVAGDAPLLVSEGLIRLLRVLHDGAGTLLALDDIHWADTDTLMVLDRLADGAGTTPTVIVLAAREDAPPAFDRILTHSAVRVIRLGPLPEPDVRALAQQCLGDASLPEHVARHVVERAEGLPFLVEELVAGLVETGVLVETAAGWEAPADFQGRVPGSFAAVVQRRLGLLDPDARDVVDAAAVLGRNVDWRLLPDLLDMAEAAVLEGLRVAVERRLMAYDGEQPDVFRFVHALTREAVLERLLPPRRLALSARAAAVLDERGDDPVTAAGLHLYAGQPERAAERLLVAAAGDAALGTREQLLRRAAELAPTSIGVRGALVDVLALAGRAEEARELGDRLLADLPAADPRRHGVALTLGRACLTESAAAAAARYVEQAGHGPHVDALAAHVAFLQERPDDAAELAKGALQSRDPAVTCEALELLGRVARLRDRSDDAESAFTRALTIAEQNGLHLERVRALHQLGTLDLLGPARPERLELARELAVETGQLSTAAILDVQLAACQALLVRHEASMQLAVRGAELAESLRLPVVAASARVFEAAALGHTGRVPQMHAVLDDIERQHLPVPELQASVRFIRVTDALVAHDLGRLRAGLVEGVQILRRSRTASPSPFRGLHALLQTMAGDGAADRDDLRISGATVQAFNRGALAYADAVAAARAGHSPEPHLAAGDAALEPLAWRRHHARLLIAPAAIAGDWGRPVEWLREAMGHFSATGDEQLARACRDQLRAAGAAVPRRGRGDSVVPPTLRRLGVTSREVDVLTLVTEGLTNSAIAERLYLSTRTVETHVASLLAKTGATGRADLPQHLSR